MNEASEIEVTAVPVKDRRTWLLVVGILQVVLGAGSFLFAILSGVMAVAAARMGTPTNTMLPGVVFYVMIGAAFVGLGIGTIRARRWARAIWLVLSTGWLFFGAVGAVGMAFWLPRMFRGMTGGPGQPPAVVMMVMMLVMMAFMAVFFVLVPLAFFLFFRSPHVKATCERLNPEASWTDTCPAPLLGAVLWMSVLGVSLLTMPFMYGGLFPLFGTFVRGAAGMGLWLATALLCVLSAFGLHRRQVWAWGLGMFLVVLFGATSAITYARADIREMYVAMGMAPFQIEQIEKMGLVSSTYMISTSVGFVVPFLVLLIWARFSLNRIPAPAVPGEPPAPGPTPTSPTPPVPSVPGPSPSEPGPSELS